MDKEWNSSDTESDWMQDFRKTMKHRALIAVAFDEGSPRYYEKLRQEGLLTEEDEREERELLATHDAVRTGISSQEDGGVEVSLTLDGRALMEEAINEAVVSL